MLRLEERPDIDLKGIGQPEEGVHIRGVLARLDSLIVSELKAVVLHVRLAQTSELYVLSLSETPAFKKKQIQDPPA